MTAKLLTSTVNGNVYNYIDYGNTVESESNPKTSVDGLIIPITKESREKVSIVGGFYRDLITPLLEDENESISRIVVLSVTTKGMGQLTGFFFEDGSENMRVSWAKEPKLATYYGKNLKTKSVEYLNINTLEFLEKLENKNSKFFKVLDFYYNPISADDTGFQVDGKVVQYGQTVIIHNIPKMIEKHSNLKGSNLDLLKIKKIELPIYETGPKIMGTIGSGLLFREDSSPITSIEDYYYSNEQDEKDYEIFLKEYYLDSIHFLAINANEKINRKPEKKEEIIREAIQAYELEKEEDSKPVKEMIGINFLLSCIEEGLVEVK